MEPSSSRSSSSDENIYDVIIIGLGAAGIAAYSKLTEKKLNVLALEGANRTGGRVHSTEFGNGIVDLGAEWCHGQKDNVVYDLIKDLNLVETSGTFGLDQITFVDSKGDVLPKDLCETLSRMCCDITTDSRDRMETDRRSLGENFYDSYYHLLTTREYNVISADVTDQVFQWLHKYENSIEASDNWFETAGSTYSEYWECEGEALLHWKGKGYTTVLDILMKSFPERHQMESENRLLNKEVTNVKWLKNGSIENTVRVKCKDESVYFAKHIIVTVSLGVLQERYHTLFSPSLPVWKANAIKHLRLGSVNKIFLHFEERWWDDDMNWVAFLWTLDMKAMFSGEDHWLHSIFGFNSNNALSNVFCLWITGEMGRHMETLPIDVVKNGVMRLLNVFFGKAYKITPLVNIMRSQWHSNPLTRGSYSFRSMETEITRNSANILSLPLVSDCGIPVICFAGEATSTHYYSTVHGAIESGYRESMRIIKHIESKKNGPSNVVDNANEKVEQCNVAIIGAGLAGLGAAKTLVDSGIVDVKILEALPDVGGRVLSCHIGAHEYLDFGAQWIHGARNKLMHLAKIHDLIYDVPSFEGEGKYLKVGGEECSNKDVTDVRDVVDRILKECETFNADGSQCDFSVGEYLNIEFEKHLRDFVKPQDHAVWRDLLDWHLRFHMVDNACDSLNVLSARAWGAYDFNGEDSQMHINLAGGFGILIKHIKESLPKEIFRTSTAVERIVWNRGTGKVKIYCTDGYISEANHVIVTVPLGVLKAEHGKMFTPPLPTGHIAAIRNLGFGRIGKVFLQYDEDWWGECRGYQFIWSSDSDVKSKFSENEKWLKYITGFDVMTVGPPNFLVGWISSDGERVMQGLPVETIKKHCDKLLRVFTGKTTIPEPIRAYRTLWGENPYFRGGFSHITRECDELHIRPSDLAEPVFDDDGRPELMFAGEACHDSFFSTAHGAYDSGVNQAERLCLWYSKTSSKPCYASKRSPQADAGDLKE